MSLAFIFIIVIFFAIITLFIVGMWQSYKEEGMLGALVVMWVIIALFVSTVYLAGRIRGAQKEKETDSKKENSASASSFFSIL